MTAIIPAQTLDHVRDKAEELYAPGRRIADLNGLVNAVAVALAGGHPSDVVAAVIRDARRRARCDARRSRSVQDLEHSRGRL